MTTSILAVEEGIYNNRNVVPGSYYDKACRKNLIDRLHGPLRKMGFHLTYEGMYRRIAEAVSVETPWHHQKHLGTKRCGLDHHIKFYSYGYVPPRCSECWKVVVSPRTIKELFLLQDVQRALNRASKCGIELRHYTPRLYGGYFYTNSLDEGRERYDEVRKAVDEHISPEVDVILKRACTEYEMIKGPSPAWVMTKEQCKLDEEIDSMVDTYSPNAIGQNENCVAQVHCRWIEWAWKFQDPTVGEFIGDMPLYSGCVTYHDGDIDEIKGDLCRAKAKVKHDIEPETTDAIRNALTGFRMTKGIGFDQIGTVLGFEDINPLYAGGEDEI